MVVDSKQPILKIDIIGKDTRRHIQVYVPYHEYMTEPVNNLFGKYDLSTLTAKAGDVLYENAPGDRSFQPLSFKLVNMLYEKTKTKTKDTLYDVTADIIKGDKAGELSGKHPAILKEGCIREKERYLLKMHITASDGSQEIDVWLPFNKGMEEEKILLKGKYKPGGVIQQADKIFGYRVPYNYLSDNLREKIKLEVPKYNVTSEIIEFQESYLEKYPDLMTKGIIREKNAVQSG